MQSQIISNRKLVHPRHSTKPWIGWRKGDTIQISWVCSQWHTVPLTCHRGTRKSSNLISRKCGITFRRTSFSSQLFPAMIFPSSLENSLERKLELGSKKSEEKKSPPRFDWKLVVSMGEKNSQDLFFEDARLAFEIKGNEGVTRVFRKYIFKSWSAFESNFFFPIRFFLFDIPSIQSFAD